MSTSRAKIKKIKVAGDVKNLKGRGCMSALSITAGEPQTGAVFALGKGKGSCLGP